MFMNGVTYLHVFLHLYVCDLVTELMGRG